MSGNWNSARDVRVQSQRRMWQISETNIERCPAPARSGQRRGVDRMRTRTGRKCHVEPSRQPRVIRASLHAVLFWVEDAVAFDA